jgi:hypothetical protein
VARAIPIRLDDQLVAYKPYIRPVLAYPLYLAVSRKSCVVPRFTVLRSIKHTSIPSILDGTTSSAETTPVLGTLYAVPLRRSVAAPTVSGYVTVQAVQNAVCS